DKRRAAQEEQERSTALPVASRNATLKSMNIILKIQREILRVAEIIQQLESKVFNYPTFAIQQIFSHTQGAMLDSKSFYKAWHMCYFSESPNNLVNVGKSDMPVSTF
ncbi:hypothetical protein JEQ12_011058, partial [Ovis aries]